MKIVSVQAREIFDSRGIPAVECEITLENGISFLASVPSGKSKSSYEALELRDKGSRLNGMGVLKAINNIEEQIAPLLVGKVPDLLLIDREMIELDGTENKKNLGANAMLSVSIAIARAQAFIEGLDLYEFLAGLLKTDSITLPFPQFNMINGGKHADNNLLIQEYMVVPIAGQNFRDAMECAMDIFYALEALLKKQKKPRCIGDEGGYAPLFDNEFEALDLLVEAINKVCSTNEYQIALDIAATQFYNTKTKTYSWHDKKLDSSELIKLYKKLVKEYPIFSLEDGLAQDDWDGWVKMTKELGSSVQLVGDDIFATSVNRIAKGVELGVGNAVIIKPNQVGTISQALYAAQFAAEHNYGIIASHRSGETEDTFITDFAVALSASQFKAGGCCRSENLSKYNRLLRIEDSLLLNLMMSV